MKWATTSSIWLTVASSAFAGARIDLRPLGYATTQGAPGDPPQVFVEPGQTVNLEVYFVDTGNPHDDIRFRGLYLDMSDIDSAIVNANNWAGVDGVFVDNSSTPLNEEADNTGVFSWVNPFGIGVVSPTPPHTSWVYPIPVPVPGLQNVLPDDGEMLAGQISITVPSDIAEYALVDVMNADAADPNLGARAVFGFPGCCGEVTIWRAHTGELTGGQLLLVPEPNVMTLLGIAAAITLRRPHQSRERKRPVGIA